jgi:hypothetical protein
MSLPSYKLSKQGQKWFAEGVLPSGRPFKIDCGAGSRDRAEGVAEIKLTARSASSRGSRERWQKWHRERAAAKTAPASAPPPAPAASPAQPPRSTSENPPRASDDELRAKLLQRGAAPPAVADKVIPPDGERVGAAADDERPTDDAEPDNGTAEDGAELIASLLAKGATLGLVGLVNLRLKRRKPPQHAEPHEKGLEYFHDGLEVVAKKLVGRTTALGTAGKITVGALIIVGSMLMTAEPIPGAAAEAAPPPADPPVAAASTSNGHSAPAPTAAPTTSLAIQSSPLGVFGVEKRTAN